MESIFPNKRGETSSFTSQGTAQHFYVEVSKIGLIHAYKELKKT